MSTLDKTQVRCTALGRQLVVARFGKDPTLSLEQREAEPEIMAALIEKHLEGKYSQATVDFNLNGQSYSMVLNRVKATK